MTALASIFFVIAEDVIAGGTIAMFDVAFAQALQNTATPAWERFFSVVSWFAERTWLAAGTLAVAVGLLVRDSPVQAGSPRRREAVS